jgi:hypothetical protein
MRNNLIVALLTIVLFGIVLLCGCLFSGTTALPALTQPSAVPSEQLSKYMLDLINKDRTDSGLAAVTLGNNTAAQDHAADMLANFYLSHWGTDGLKPYMRYTLAGGINYEAENSAYHGWYDTSQDPDRYVTIDPKEVLKQLQYNMMFDDADSNWGHRDTILSKLSKKVNIGIAYDKHRLALVQQFEGDYVNFTNLPAIVNGKLSLAGNLNLGKLYSLHIFYDPLQQLLTQQQLLEKPRSYDSGEEMGYVLPPKLYMDSKEYVTAIKWNVDATGSFTIEADVSHLLKYKTGVYNISLVSSINGELTSLSNYSIFIR